MKVNRAELLETLKKIQPGLSTAKDAAAGGQAHCVVFEADRVFSFNNEVAITLPYATDVVGAFVAAPLIEVLGRMPDETIDILATAAEMRITGKKTKVGIRREATVSLPIGEIGQAKAWSRLPVDFVQAVRFCRFSAARGTACPVLGFLNIKGRTVESCDNFRLTRYTMQSAVKEDVMFRAAAVAELTEYPIIQLGQSPGWTHFRDKEGLVYSCRSLTGEYPDLSPLIVDDGAPVDLPKELVGALERAEIFTKGMDDGANFVSVQIMAGCVLITGTGPNGWYKERTDAPGYTGDPLCFSVQPDFLKDSLHLLNKATVSTGKLKLEGANFVHVVNLLMPTAAKEE